MRLLRGDIVLVALDPTVGSETSKPRPCLVVSPDDINAIAPTVIVVPLTSKLRSYLTRVDCELNGQEGQAMTEQVRAVSYQRVLRQLSHNPALVKLVLDRLQELFAF